MSTKCITLRAPWAEAVFALGKDVENRSWLTNYRGTLAIHAGCHVIKADALALGLDPAQLRTGVILGTVELVDCVLNSKSKWAWKGEYHWLLRNPRRLAHPIVRLGQLGLYNVSLKGCKFVPSSHALLAPVKV